ncbi:MAG: acetate---CoA ligase (ADP-forming) subunit alpha [Desulfobacteraceae bacterium Eth-SRB2]|nr:MAG: acetate---CoA ligase (ADP-forming) subunit alpha [Desulfobacteraceae bacterium Eth-SRB2]
MEKFFYPESVVVVGVSESEDNLGQAIISNLVNFDYNGKIYAVGPKGGRVKGIKIYLSVPDVPISPDLAVILTPARFIPEIMTQCGKKGIKHAVIESAGFREMGKEGYRVEKDLIAASKRFGIRFIGPNCVGLINTLNGLYVPFIELPSEFKKGNVSVMSQSGGIGLSVAERLNNPGLGLSKFVSMGNKLNMDEADLLAYLIKDPDTAMIYCYLEDFKRGRDFADIALRSGKPVILHKSNTNPLSHTIAKSHTAALAVDDKIVDAACTNSGVVRVQSIEEAIFAIKGISMPLLQGKNLAILSRSGGHSVVAADMCAIYGFNLPQLHPGILEEAKSYFRAGVMKIGNPMDLGDIFDFHIYSQIAEKIMRQPDIHGIVYIHVSQIVIENEDSIQLMKKLTKLSFKYNKPIAIVAEVPLSFQRMLMEEMTHAFFMDPVEAFRALALQYRYAAFRQKKSSTVKEAAFPLKDNVKLWMEEIQEKNRQPLLHEALELLNRIEIPMAPWRMVTTFSEAREAAKEMGYPVVIKAVSSALLHKSDQGGIAINIRNAEAMEKQWEEIHSRFKDIIGIVLQKMIFASREIIVGAKRDPAFGPVVLVGMGGIMVEVTQDVSMRLAPVSEDDANEMIDQLQGAKVLGPFRGMKAADRHAIAQCLVTVSQLMHHFPDIQEIDVNPLILSDDGNYGMAVDGRVICSNITSQ